MGQLSENQIDFLRSQKISLREVFDATGMRKVDYAAAMEESGQHLAFGVTPCAAGGHSLRTKAGHCIQCDTSKIAYALRHSHTATVYLAGSHAQRMLKVGLALDRSDRLRKLNEYCYGGASDWEMLAYSLTKGAGKVEFAAQEGLRAFQHPGSYLRAGREQACYELFRCDYATAKKAILLALPKESVLRLTGPEDRILTVYNFT